MRLVGEERDDKDEETQDEAAGDDPGFASAVIDVGVTLEEGGWVRQAVPRRNLKEKGREVAAKMLSTE